jgi:hypothetical protein
VLSDVVFAGQHVSWLRVMNIAEDPVVNWGPVYDEQGNVLQGELWVLVAKHDKFIYLHLTDTPNPASDTTAYGGYTVKMKAISTAQFYGFGYGGGVPVIGNDTDAFLTTSTKLMVHSAFTEGEPQQLNISTGVARDYLVHLYDMVQSYSQPPALSAGRWTAMQFVAPDGTELIAPMSHYEVGSSDSSSSLDCQAFGEAAGDAVSTLAGGFMYANVALTAVEAAALDKILTGATGGLGGKAGIGVGVKLAAGVQASVYAFVGTGLSYLTDALYSALAEGACEALSTPDEIPVLPPIELGMGVDDVVFVQTVAVCDRTEMQQVGSTAKGDEDSGIEVQPVDEEVCVEWHYEVVEE